MRRARSLPRAVFVLAAVLSLGRHAAAETPPEPAPDTVTEEARRHFRLGITLYREANYPGALAEFEAAYRLKPGPGSLQNIALCQKALFRYAEAADSLGLLLERHGSELSPEERSAAELARKELVALVASVVVRVSPTHAQVTFGGRTLAPGELGAPLRVNVGEHAVAASAPGYAPVAKTFRVAAGAVEQPLEIALEPIMGFVAVTASDPNAVIAIDGRPLGLGRYQGPVTPGEEHLIQVYRSGFQTFEERIQVERGKTVTLSASLGPADGEPSQAPVDAKALPPPPEERPPRGWYSVAAFTLFGVAATPFDFDTTNARSSVSTLSLGVRVGRRLFPTLGGEVLLELGSHRVENACDKRAPEPGGGTCGGGDQVDRDYTLGWLRFGPIVRVMTPAEPFRVSGGLGAGVVFHDLRLERVPATGPTLDPNAPMTTGGRERGAGPFAMVELGASYHFGHLFVGADLSALVDGTRGLAGTFDGDAQSPFEESGLALPMVGLGLRVGYHQWHTKRRQR